MKSDRITIKKYNGDDNYSWAIFKNDNPFPSMTGLTKREAEDYKKMILKKWNERKNNE